VGTHFKRYFGATIGTIVQERSALRLYGTGFGGDLSVKNPNADNSSPTQ
jgi:hypothetical protein